MGRLNCTGAFGLLGVHVRMDPIAYVLAYVDCLRHKDPYSDQTHIHDTHSDRYLSRL